MSTTNRPNIRVQATLGCAPCELLSQYPGAPDPVRPG
jgi:hypothetical protein